MEHWESTNVAETHREIREHLTKEVLLWAWRLGIETKDWSIFEIAHRVFDHIGEKPLESDDDEAD